MVGPVVHGVEDDFEFDGLGGSGLSNDFDGHHVNIIDVVVLVNEPEVRERRGRTVCYRTRDIYGMVSKQRGF